MEWQWQSCFVLGWSGAKHAALPGLEKRLKIGSVLSNVIYLLILLPQGLV